MNTSTPAKKSDLGVRTLSAIVMLAVAGGALWLGGWWWTAFVALVAMGVLWEWHELVAKFESLAVKRWLWNLCGAFYVGGSAAFLVLLRTTGGPAAFIYTLLVVGMVIGTDVGAYLFGRTIGGPKIAPTISPSKTWSGLVGGMLGSALVFFLSQGYGCVAFIGPSPGWLECWVVSLDLQTGLVSLAVGALTAIVAQSGDFFESWMKRRAGVKDSGNLIPGHGGLFDRVDGLLAVCFVLGVIFMISSLWGGA